MAVKNKKPAPVPDAHSEAGWCVYLGPTIIGKIQTGTIYQGSRAEVLDRLAPVISEHPQVASLVVTSDTLPVDRIKVKTPGNLLYENYRKILRGK